MTEDLGLMVCAAYEYQLTHKRDRTRGLLALARYALELDIIDLVFPGMLRFAAHYSQGQHSLLDAARDTMPALLEALAASDVESFDAAMAAAYDDPTHMMPVGWMAHLLRELEKALTA